MLWKKNAERYLCVCLHIFEYREYCIHIYIALYIHRTFWKETKNTYSRNLRVGARVIYILLFHCISFVLFDILPYASITFSMQVLKKLVKKEQKILLLKASSSHHSRVPNPANHSSTPSVPYSSLLLFCFPTLCSSLLVFCGLPWRSHSSLSARHDGVNIRALVLISHFLKTSQHPTCTEDFCWY